MDILKFRAVMLSIVEAFFLKISLDSAWDDAFEIFVAILTNTHIILFFTEKIKSNSRLNFLS
jgi:hypothetical protein